MAVWAPYLIAYLIGVATPIFILKSLLRNRDDGGSCLFNIILGMVGSLILIVIWLGLET